jgi:hypothetical protein
VQGLHALALSVALLVPLTTPAQADARALWERILTKAEVRDAIHTYARSVESPIHVRHCGRPRPGLVRCRVYEPNAVSCESGDECALARLGAGYVLRAARRWGAVALYDEGTGEWVW